MLLGLAPTWWTPACQAEAGACVSTVIDFEVAKAERIVRLLGPARFGGAELVGNGLIRVQVDARMSLAAAKAFGQMLITLAEQGERE